MSKFKVGDKVICVDRDGLESDPIELGKVYEVVSVYEFHISLDVGDGEILQYYPRRFKLVEQTTPECPYVVIEELSAQVDNLEELVSEQAERIRQLEAVLSNFARLTKYFSEEGSDKLPNAKIGDDVVDAILDYFRYQDSSLQEQAQCYFRLNSLLTGHESFQESGKCRSDELADTIVLLQRSYDNYQSLGENKPRQFKSISEYTLSDWQNAMNSDWVFECRNGDFTKIHSIDDGETAYPVESTQGWLKLDGSEFWNETSTNDIIERIK